MLEQESFLRKGDVPEEDGDRRECNDVGESSPLLNEPRPASIQAFSHSGVTAMMI